MNEKHLQKQKKEKEKRSERKGISVFFENRLLQSAYQKVLKRYRAAKQKNKNNREIRAGQKANKYERI